MSLRSVSLLALILDQASKFYVSHHWSFGSSQPVIPDYLFITYIQNPGAAFGFMANAPAYARIPFFVLITLGAGLIVYAYQRFLPRENWVPRLALGLIWGGAMGNFVDRVFHGKVVDFIDVYYYWFHQHRDWWIFNLADSCITVGIILLLAYYFWGKKRQTPGEVLNVP